VSTTSLMQKYVPLLLEDASYGLSHIIHSMKLIRFCAQCQYTTLLFYKINSNCPISAANFGNKQQL